MSLVQEVVLLTHSYARKGGKDNRRQQRSRMVAFVEFISARGVKSFGQVGRAHVIEYWKARRKLSPATAYNHWLALRELWRLAGRAGDPPKPRQIEGTARNKSSRAECEGQ